MAVSTVVLRELHRIHGQLSDLRERLDRGPRQVKVREVNAQQQQSALEFAQDSVKQTKLAIDQKQLDLKSGELKVEDLKAKLNTCSSNKEYQALLEQIAAAEMAGSVLADEILDALEKEDRLQVAVTEAQSNLEIAKQELTKCRTKVAEEATQIRADIERLEDELVGAEKELPTDFKADYERVIRGKGAEGMAEVDGRVCLGCGFQITLNMQNDLLLSKPIFCKSCGCLLYMGEN